jgi:replication factor C small subunit
MNLNEVKVAVDSTLWVEKYKPTSIDDVLCPDHLKTKFKEYIDSNDIPSLLFQGTAGNGKTTCARLIANKISEDVLFINASNESGIDVVRNKIEPFCAVQGLGDGFKVVILDEMEMSSENFQTALREVIERFYETTRFILTCNFINKVIEPLKSRTQEYKFGDIKQIEILKRCFAILNAENVSYEKKNVAKVVTNLGTDMRRIINALQQLTVTKDGEKELAQYTSMEERQMEVLKLIKAKKLSELRKYIGEHNLGADELVKFIFNKSFEKELGSRWVEILAELSETAYRLKVGVDPEITLVNGVSQIMQLIE